MTTAHEPIGCLEILKKLIATEPLSIGDVGPCVGL